MRRLPLFLLFLLSGCGSQVGHFSKQDVSDIRKFGDALLEKLLALDVVDEHNFETCFNDAVACTCICIVNKHVLNIRNWKFVLHDDSISIRICFDSRYIYAFRNSSDDVWYFLED